MSGDPNYLKLLDEMRELHIKKNAGYSGDSTDREDTLLDLASYALIAICLRREETSLLTRESLDTLERLSKNG